MILSIIINQPDDLDYYATITLIKDLGEPDVFPLGPYDDFQGVMSGIKKWTENNDDL
jgi:hypothetical protein